MLGVDMDLDELRAERAGRLRLVVERLPGGDPVGVGVGFPE
ncbi:MAG TPA: hypothetical protein VGQ38_02705 [Gaiellaceae bacterium]|nr:hypothetical protein [Gaiellaceae bacterium]